MDSEEKLRQEAVQSYLQGVSVSSISTKLSKSRQWIYKWVSRYENSSDPQWYREHSRAPLTHSSELPGDIEHAIIEVRKRLAGKPYSQKGAISILYELKELGIQAPSVSTINRVLKR